MATISRLLQITGLFCRIYSLLQGSFAKETYDFKEFTNCSQPIVLCITHTPDTHHQNIVLFIGLYCKRVLQKRPIISRSLLIAAAP